MLVLALGSLVFAGERKVPSQYSTIQAAVDAAASGDVITCAPGTYAEAVTATKSGITISGAGATWDGSTGAGAVTCVSLVGDANVVSGFTFKNGVDHVVLTGDDCRVEDAVSLDASGSLAVVTGARGRVDNCRAERTGRSAVIVEGDSAIVIDVDVDTSAAAGVDVQGDGCKVKYCRVEDCDDRGYRVRGEDCEVKYCEAYSCATAGFELEVDYSASVSNYAEACGSADGAGFLLIGSHNTVTLSDAWECAPHGHRWRGDDNWCYDNWADWCEEDGFRCEGDDNDCEDNRARDCGRDGYRCEGDRNWFYDCDAFDCLDDGFDVETGSDNYLKYCTGKYNEGAGCENGGVDTDVYACVFLYNEVDIGLDGSSGACFDLFSFNTYLTGSLSAILKLGFGL
ncbi:MAG TPA: right-handed parallel beta-helix repeat-containing protein [Planctomycetota bacterium]|nr:right-handed parallel beta-helix repeat-containing protein [Planctomycetota bacterium]